MDAASEYGIRMLHLDVASTKLSHSLSLSLIFCSVSIAFLLIVDRFHGEERSEADKESRTSGDKSISEYSDDDFTHGDTVRTSSMLEKNEAARHQIPAGLNSIDTPHSPYYLQSGDHPGNKLSPRYMGPFKVLERVGPVAYRLKLPDTMRAFHKVFHVSMLKKCLHKDDNVLAEIPFGLRPNMTVEARPVKILEKRIKAERRKKTPEVKVLWDYNGADEETWEPEARMKAKFSQWFAEQADAEAEDSRTNLN